MNRPGVRRVRIRILDFSGNDVGSSPIIQGGYFASGTASTPYSINISDNIFPPLDNPYTISVSTSTATFGTVFSASTNITVTAAIPVVANPLVVSPANGSTVSLCQDLTATVNGNYTGSRRFNYSVYETLTPANVLVPPTDVFFTNASEATSNFDIDPILASSLTANTQYSIQVQSFDPEDIQIGVTVVSTFLTGPAIVSSPVVTLPADGATGVSVTPTINVAAYAGCGTLSTVTIEVDRFPADWAAPDRQIETFINDGGPFSWSPATPLDYGAQYQVRVRFNSSAGPVYTTVTSFTTLPITPTNPLLNSPADQSTATLCSDVILNVNANNVAAQRLQVKVFPNGNAPGAIYDSTFTFTNSTQATTAFNVTVLRTLFTPGVQYLIELTSRTAANGFVGQSYNTLNTSNAATAAANTPVIIDPADASTVNTFTPTIQIQSPFAGCTLTSVTYEILLGTIGNTVVSTATFNTPTYAWTVPVFLTAGATYRARVTYNTAIGTFSDTNTFTVSATPTVSITSPLDLTNLDPCGFPVSVAAYPNATTVKVEYKRTAEGTYTEFYSTPVVASTPMSFAFGNTQLQPDEDYDLRLTAGTGTGVGFVPFPTSVADFAFFTGDISGNLTPALASPTNGATGVSLTPTITFAPYAGTCGQVNLYQVEIVPNTGTGDWNTRAGYFSLNSATPSITVPSGQLQAGTTYKVRATVGITLNGSPQIFRTSYDSADPGIYTFTTINPNETRLDLVTSASNTVGGIIYLNSEVQTVQVLAVPGVTQYEIQLSTDSTFATAQYTATSNTTTFTFNANATGLESSTRYFVRARITQPTVGQWTSTPNIRSFVNSLHPTYADRPVGNIAANSTRLRGWHARNATSMFFQIATDPGFTNLVNAAGPYGPILTDPAGSGIAYERYSYRRWVGSSLTFVAIGNASDAGFAPFNTLGEYDYVRYLIPGQTYYIRVKNVRQAPNGTYLQTGYWAGVASFTPAAATRTHSISLLGAPSAVPVNLVANTPYIQTNPQGTWNVIERQVQLSTVADFSTLVLDLSDFNGGPGFALNTTLNFSTNYFMRVRSRAANDPAGPLVWTPWSSAFAFRTMDPTSGRVAAAAMSTDGSQLVQTVAFPNPFVDDVAVSVKSTYKAVTLTLVDATGRVVDSANTLGGYTVLLGRKQLASGLYVIRITDESGLLETLKVVKQ